MKRVVLAFALILAAVVATSGQSSDMQAMAQQFGVSAKQNAAALKMYTWKMRVEVSLKGEAKPAKLFQMRFDADGKLQKTSLTQAAPPSQPQRGLKGRIVAKKTAEMKDYVEDLAELCKGYLTPSPALLQAFFSRVMTAQAPGGLGPAIRDRRDRQGRQAGLRDRSEDAGDPPGVVHGHARRATPWTARSSSPQSAAAGRTTRRGPRSTRPARSSPRRSRISSTRDSNWRDHDATSITVKGNFQ